MSDADWRAYQQRRKERYYALVTRIKSLMDQGVPRDQALERAIDG